MIKSITSLLAIVIYAIALDVANASQATFKLVNPGVGYVDIHTPLRLQIRASFDAALVAAKFDITANGGPTLFLTGRSADFDAVSGLSYIPVWSMDWNDLSRDLTNEGASIEVLIQKGSASEGITPGTDVLLYEIEVTPHELGTATIAISQASSATTNGAMEGVLFDSVGIDPIHEYVVFEVVSPLDCSATPPPDAFHPDSDNDDIPDVCDKCPGFDDGIDSDTDGIADGCDNCAIPNHDQADMDSDGVGDLCDPDLDGDGICNSGGPLPAGTVGASNGCQAGPNGVDNCPNTANPDQSDVDHDGVGDTCDQVRNLPVFDYNNDGFVDMLDFAMLQQNTTTGLNAPPGANDPRLISYDVNKDGIVDEKDAVLFARCASGPEIPAAPACGDYNNNGIHDAGEDIDHEGHIDGDSDLDGINVRGLHVCANGEVQDCDDNCPCVFNQDQQDTDGDGIGDACDPCTDTDGDGYGDPGFAANTCMLDNCPSVYNPYQEDTDGNGVGNACEAPPGYGGGCENDNDCDGIFNEDDNCLNTANADQIDSDSDGIGDACLKCPNAMDPGQSDSDGDGIGDECDNCPTVQNADQVDSNHDGVGDACELDLPGITICPGDSVTLSAAPGNGGDEVWWFRGSCGGTSEGTTPGNQIVSPSSTTTYYARTKHSETGCWAETCTQITVKVGPCYR